VNYTERMNRWLIIYKYQKTFLKHCRSRHYIRRQEFDSSFKLITNGSRIIRDNHFCQLYLSFCTIFNIHLLDINYNRLSFSWLNFTIFLCFYEKSLKILQISFLYLTQKNNSNTIINIKPFHHLHRYLGIKIVGQMVFINISSSNIWNRLIFSYKKYTIVSFFLLW
jgi:hypothetical protein